MYPHFPFCGMGSGSARETSWTVRELIPLQKLFCNQTTKRRRANISQVCAAHSAFIPTVGIKRVWVSIIIK